MKTGGYRYVFFRAFYIHQHEQIVLGSIYTGASYLLLVFVRMDLDKRDAIGPVLFLSVLISDLYLVPTSNLFQLVLLLYQAVTDYFDPL